MKIKLTLLDGALLLCGALCSAVMLVLKFTIASTMPLWAVLLPLALFSAPYLLILILYALNFALSLLVISIMFLVWLASWTIVLTWFAVSGLFKGRK